MVGVGEFFRGGFAPSTTVFPSAGIEEDIN